MLIARGRSSKPGWLGGRSPATRVPEAVPTVTHFLPQCNSNPTFCPTTPPPRPFHRSIDRGRGRSRAVVDRSVPEGHAARSAATHRFDEPACIRGPVPSEGCASRRPGHAPGLLFGLPLVRGAARGLGERQRRLSTVGRTVAWVLECQQTSHAAAAGSWVGRLPSWRRQTSLAASERGSLGRLHASEGWVLRHGQQTEPCGARTRPKPRPWLERSGFRTSGSTHPELSVTVLQSVRPVGPTVPLPR